MDGDYDINKLEIHNHNQERPHMVIGWTVLQSLKCHTSILTRFHCARPLAGIIRYLMGPRFNLYSKFSVVIPRRERWFNGARVDFQAWGPRMVYGWLTVCGGGATSVFQAEVFAILVCIQHIQDISGISGRINFNT